MKMHLKMTLYLKLVIAEIFYRLNKDRGKINEIYGNAGLNGIFLIYNWPVFSQTNTLVKVKTLPTQSSTN